MQAVQFSADQCNAVELLVWQCCAVQSLPLMKRPSKRVILSPYSRNNMYSDSIVQYCRAQCSVVDSTVTVVYSSKVNTTKTVVYTSMLYFAVTLVSITVV